MRSRIFLIALASCLALSCLQKGLLAESETGSPRQAVTSKQLASAERLRDIKGPLEPKASALLLILCLSSAMVLTGLLVHSLRRATWPTTSASLPAEGTASEVLEKLKEEYSQGDMHAKTCYAELSFIVRVQLRRRFDLRTLQMTTEELLAALDERQCPDVLRNAIGDFLAYCDKVKFSGYQPPHEDMQRSFGTAKQIIDGTGEDRLS